MAESNKNANTPTKVTTTQKFDDASKPDGIVGFASFRSVEGPLPPAEEFAAYNQALPGSAERILSMAERQAAHRILCEGKLVDADVNDVADDRTERRLGQVFGFIFSITALVLGSTVAIKGEPTAGAAIATVGVASVVGAFLWTRKASEPPKEDTQNKGAGGKKR